MLKTQVGQEYWCIEQPDHGVAAGYLAAHWGNDEFTRPGYFAATADPESLRGAVVLGVGQHDNGWWEWEATPELSPVSGLPLDLMDVFQAQQEGMSRWRRGIPRFAETHPYAGLLASFHAYWLYAVRCDGAGTPFVHPFYWKKRPPLFEGRQLDEVKAFLTELEGLQQELIRMLSASPNSVDWSRPEHLESHGRLTQILDGLSLSLCSNLIPDRNDKPQGPGKNAFTLNDVPRGRWHDRVSLEVAPVGEHQISCHPYPFDVDPLPVSVPLRMVPVEEGRDGDFLSWWYGTEKRMIRYELCSRSTEHRDFTPTQTSVPVTAG